jgi:hypothetical protein
MLEKSWKPAVRSIGKLVKIQHGPATVSVEDRSTKPLFRREWEGRPAR